MLVYPVLLRYIRQQGVAIVESDTHNRASSNVQCRLIQKIKYDVMQECGFSNLAHVVEVLVEGQATVVIKPKLLEASVTQ